MQQIEIDFQVFKALTNLREDESHTYNEVLRDLLGLEKSLGRQLGASLRGLTGAFQSPRDNGFTASGRFLPHGTLLRARYKGKAYYASIKDGAWMDEDETCYSSASAAARSITQTNVNGLTFWEAKRPSDTEWRKLDALPKAAA